jgi:acyl-CoA reductase-like NAD-dependent aldehyde dehydrogenase
MIEHCPHYIDGDRAQPTSGRFLPSLDPSTGEVIAMLADGDAQDADRAVRAAAAAAPIWAHEHTPAQRGALLLRLADLVLAHREDLARMETRDVGKPISASRGDIDGVVETLRYNAGAADKMEGSVIPLGEAVVDFTRLEPLGVTAHITPWNFPLGMAARSLAPALAAGCTAVLKPAEQSPLSALAVAELATEAGIPPGVVNVLQGRGETAGAALVAHPGVQGVTFTGSVATGRLVAQAAAARICPVVLELGGKNAMIVWHDADLDRAVADAMAGGFENAGQVCSAASRLILHRDIAEPFCDRLAERIAALRIGRGTDDPDLGPLVSEVQRDAVESHVARARGEGARVRCGGERPAQPQGGFFYAPTLIDGVPEGAAILREEVFGPVVTASAVATEDAALALANGVGFGLVAGIQTRELSRALRFAQRLEAGSVWINGWYLGGVQAPTGGTKHSGYGRERGLAGVRNYLRIKNVAIRL